MNNPVESYDPGSSALRVFVETKKDSQRTPSDFGPLGEGMSHSYSSLDPLSRSG